MSSDLPDDTHPPTGPAPAPDGRATTAELVLTGERTLPGIPDERYWFVRHEVAYHRLAELLADEPAADPAVDPAAVVLDAGCGEGYGLEVLADAGAARVIGADLDAASVAHARARYAATDARIEVVHCELSALPLADGEVDLTVSLQVIEHVWDVPGYLASLRRVTRAGGLIAIATPNRLTFTPDSDVPVNPFHVTEFAPDELRAALRAAGLVIEDLHGLHHTGALATFEATHGLSLPHHLGAIEPDAWSTAVRDRVHATDAADFAWRDDALTTSLDLLAVCRVPA
jgi:SAM-dependent methyltransferase